jgi:hypothetical protein
VILVSFCGKLGGFTGGDWRLTGVSSRGKETNCDVCQPGREEEEENKVNEYLRVVWGRNDESRHGI